jgi:hypothetical protein
VEHSDAEDFLLWCGELQRLCVDALTSGLRREIEDLGGIARGSTPDHGAYRCAYTKGCPLSPWARATHFVEIGKSYLQLVVVSGENSS